LSKLKYYALVITHSLISRAIVINFILGYRSLSSMTQVYYLYLLGLILFHIEAPNYKNLLQLSQLHIILYMSLMLVTHRIVFSKSLSIHHITFHQCTTPFLEVTTFTTSTQPYTQVKTIKLTKYKI